MCRTLHWKGSGLDDALKHTKAFTVKTVYSVLNGTQYVRSFKAFIILASEKMKWKAFSKQNENVRFRVFDDFIQFQHALAEKDHQKSKKAFELCSSNIPLLKQEFKKFSDECAIKSEMCRYWNELIKFANILKLLIASDREGNWEGHLQSIQSLLPLFLESGSINYVRYDSWYLEKMRKLPTEHPDIHQEFMKGKFVVKTSPGFLKQLHHI